MTKKETIKFIVQMIASIATAIVTARYFVTLFINEAFASHFLGLLQPHDVENGWSYVG
jgi:hypothetical protein